MTDLPAVTAATFDAEVIRASGPVIVDFWAPWCAPCRQVKPVLERVAAAGANVVTVNADEEPDLAQRYRVTGLPTIVVFDCGEVAARVTGAKPRALLLRDLDAWLP